MPNALVKGLVCAGVVALAGVGCKAPELVVLRQQVPVSTVPAGAKVLVDGQPAGQTPTTVSLERTRDHIVTLQLDPYRQEDIVVRHLYQQERTMLKAVQSGLDAGLFFKDARMGVGSAMRTSDQMEATGEAFRLDPGAIAVTLRPSGATGPALVQAQAQAQPAAGDGPAGQDRRGLTRDLAITGAAVAVAAAQPTVGRTWDKSSSQTTVSKDGKTVTRTETRTSTGVKVGVSAKGVAGILETLFK